MGHAATCSAVLAVLALAACGGNEPQPIPPPPPTAASDSPAPVATTAPTTGAPVQTQEEAHKLLVLAVSCWFGGLWGDALGEQDQAKVTGIETRCHELERRVWSTDDKAHLEQVRAFEQNAVSDVIAAVDQATKTDTVDGPRRDALLKLAGAFADAARETMLARRAGERVKRDLTREPDKLTTDEVDAVGPLRAHAKLEALLKLDAGDLSKEANALGLLCATDRVELARGLPKHLKLYAVADTFQIIFGVTPPDVPQDATTKLVPGTWLKFLTDTAAAAGHPVTDKAKKARERDALAWGGMQQGFGEKLAADSSGIAPTTDLSKVVTTVLHRLETEYSAQQAAEASQETGPAKPAKKSP
jgi:hypothetical protein